MHDDNDHAADDNHDNHDEHHDDEYDEHHHDVSAGWDKSVRLLLQSRGVRLEFGQY